MEMNEAIARELWQEKMTGEISEENDALLHAFLATHEALKKELSEMEQTWSLFEAIERPEPSQEMDSRFIGMLAAYEEARSRPTFSFLDQAVAWMSRSWQVGLASLVMGLFIGWWMLPSQHQQQDILQLSNEIQSMKEMMMLTLIEQPKAQERIRAVSLASELPSADQKVINALISTLNHDENLNVRLAALESLVGYADHPGVRQALVEALKMQESPLLLVGIADALVAIQETSSVNAMEQLKETVEDEFVKEKLDESIATLRNS